MAEWPADLPQKPQFQNYQETPPNVILRQAMDVGPAKVRKRFTAGVGLLRLRFIFTQDELTLFHEFFTQTIQSGAMSFEWVHPRTDEAILCRLIPPPTYVPMGLEWQVDFQVEILP